MKKSQSLNGAEFIVVVGSAKGIGKAVSEHLFNDKAQMVLALDRVYDRSFRSIASSFVASSKAGISGQAELIRSFVDVESPKGRVVELRKWFTDNKAKVKGLVYCVGNNKLVWMGKGATNVASRVLKTNVLGIFSMVEGLMPVMTETCRVVIFSSIAGEIPMRTTAPYCVSKAAVNMMVKCFARELAPKPVFCVMPGPTDGDNSYLDTERQIHKLRGWPMEMVRETTLKDIPMGRLATEEECAKATSFCLLEAPAHASGMTFRLTGGR